MENVGKYLPSSVEAVTLTPLREGECHIEQTESTSNLGLQ